MAWEVRQERAIEIEKDRERGREGGRQVEYRSGKGGVGGMEGD